MQMLMSPGTVVVSSSWPTANHRTVAISPEEIAMRMLDYTVNEMRNALLFSIRPSIPATTFNPSVPLPCGILYHPLLPLATLTN